MFISGVKTGARREREREREEEMEIEREREREVGCRSKKQGEKA